MIKTELVYNPYVGVTEVRFNGNPPKINSLIEKYLDKNLNDWVNQIPDIFYDEMNGYDFDLEFSGTREDFEKVQHAFDNRGVSHSEVRVILKNELESRASKVKKIDNTLQWLKENQNRNFDLVSTISSNKALLEDNYSYVIIKGSHIDTSSLAENDITAVKLDDVSELELTDLHYTPILFCINPRNMRSFQKDLISLLNRSDTQINQFFFYFEKLDNSGSILRVIQDLGIPNPSVITNVYDSVVRDYFETYPMTEYISETIKLFNQQVDVIGEKLKKSSINNKESEIKTLSFIQESEENIKRLKNADSNFYYRDNVFLPYDMKREQMKLEQAILAWRNRLAITTNEVEARKFASDLNDYYKHYYIEFWNNTNSLLIKQEDVIKKKYHEMYASAGIDESYEPDIKQTSKVRKLSFSPITDSLMNVKEEYYRKSNNKSEKVLIKETAYYYKVWKERTRDLAIRVSDKEIEYKYHVIKQYADELSQAYRNHISELIDRETYKKNNNKSKLSTTELLLQSDNDWLETLQDYLNEIERG